MSHKIPKIIHQIWNDNNIPHSVKFCADSWKEMNPDWQYKLWTEDERISWMKANHPELLDIYIQYPRAATRSDMFRYLMLEKIGGVYVDLDIECLKPLNYFFSTYVKYGEFVIGCEPYAHARLSKVNRMISNAFVASMPGHPMLNKITDEVIKRAKRMVKNTDTIMKYTDIGPDMANDCIKDDESNLDIIDWKVLFPIVDIGNNVIPIFDRCVSFWMLMNKRFFKETCAVHYWCHMNLDGTHHMEKIFRICKKISPKKWKTYCR